MASVTSRARSVKQPRGGYVKPSDFTVIQNEDNEILYDEENISGSTIGMVVDYLTRLSLGATPEEAFNISLNGAILAEDYYRVQNAKSVAAELLKDIKGIDDQSIINACKLVSFDVWIRKPSDAKYAKEYTEINPDKPTIHNIRVFVQRCEAVFREYGPITKSEVSFGPENDEDYGYGYEAELVRFFGVGRYGGYTGTVNSGDGDYLTKDTLWDVKVLRSKLTSKHTLQLLMYWIMGQHSGQNIFKEIKRLGIFNPRINTVYLIDVKNIPIDIIHAVEDEVICYTGLYHLEETNAGIRFVLKSSSDETVAISKVYKSRSSCKNGIKSFKEYAPQAEIEDHTIEEFSKNKNPKFEIYKDDHGLYFFNLKPKNGGMLATCEGYQTKSDCLKCIEQIRKHFDSPVARSY